MSHKIVYGKWIFPVDKIRDGNLYLATSLLASSLEVSSLNATVECDDPSILDFQRNAELLYYASPDRPMVFRVQGITRVGPALYELFSTSTLGLLTEGQHMGGIYTGQTAGEVIASICGTVPFIVKTNLTEVKLYGWLPIAPPRDNLAQVLFAIGAALKTDLDGVLRIEGLWDGISGQVPADNMYIDASADYSAKVTQVIVTEHQYVPWTEEKQLFEGTAQQGDIITFDDPMHTLTAEGFTILDSGANWAKVSAGSGVLSGKTYLHNTRQISKDVWPAQEPNVKIVKDATLVSLVNSQACAGRLAAYYQCREQINAPVVYQGEMPGDRLAVYHPFDKTGVDACLESADITLSGTLKAQEKSLVGFVPTKTGEIQYYDAIDVLTGEGYFDVPPGTFLIRAIVIGAGSGGASGEYGKDSPDPEGRVSSDGILVSYWNGFGADGGDGGKPGLGGKILVRDINVTPGDRIKYKAGIGGIGGKKNKKSSVTGAVGEESYFGALSSSGGELMPSGYIEPITGNVYAGDGRVGIHGGKGAGRSAKSPYILESGTNVFDYSGNTWTPGDINEKSQPYIYDFHGSTVRSFSGYGQGGGPAVGSNGFAGNSGDIGYGYVYTGKSGKGADAIKPSDASVYGKGGDGGHGGGGEGGLGSASANPIGVNGNYINLMIGLRGGPGAGSDGANGANGCIILYYRAEKKQNEGQLVDKNGKMVLDRLGRRIIV